MIANRITLSLAALLVLPGCGSLVGEKEEVVDPPAELVEFQQSLEIDRLWDRNTGGGTNKQYLTLSPVVSGERVFIADTNRKLLSLDAGTGRNLWSYQLRFGDRGWFNDDDQVYITGGPGYGEQTLLIGTSKGDVVAIDAETGKERWVAKVTSEILSPPQIANNVVVVRTLDGRVYGLDAASGRRLWSYDRTVPALTLRGNSAPVIEGGVVIVGFDGGHLVALELTSGRQIWEASISQPRGRSELDRMVDIDATPVVLGGIVYVVTYQGQLAALAMDNGRMLWNRQLSSHAGFTVDDDNIYITDDHSIIWAIDRLNGSSVWKQDGLANRQVTAPASIGNYLVVGDFEGYLHWLNKTTGAFSARQKIAGDRIIAAPVSNSGAVYAYSTNGRLAALSYE